MLFDVSLLQIISFPTHAAHMCNVRNVRYACENIYYLHSLEAPRRVTSNEYHNMYFHGEIRIF